MSIVSSLVEGFSLTSIVGVLTLCSGGLPTEGTSFLGGLTAALLTVRWGPPAQLTGCAVGLPTGGAGGLTSCSTPMPGC